MNPNTLLIAAAALLAGWILGLCSPRFEDASAAVEPIPASADKPAVQTEDSGADWRHELSQAIAENADLTNQLQLAKTQIAATTAGSADFPLPKKFIADLSFQVVVGNQVSPELTELLHLTDSEVTTVNAAIAATRDRLKDLQVEHESLVSQTPTAVKIAIDSFKAEGDEVHSLLAQQAQTALGTERSGMFMTFMDRAGLEAFPSSFGASKEQVTITSMPKGIYRIETDYQTTNQGSGSMTMTGTTVPSEYTHLFDTGTAAPSPAGK